MSEAPKPTPNYNTPIPESIMTPDKVETRIGTLEFSDGLPSPETTQLVYDNLDFPRAVQSYLANDQASHGIGIPGSLLGEVRIHVHHRGEHGQRIADELILARLQDLFVKDTGLLPRHRFWFRWPICGPVGQGVHQQHGRRGGPNRGPRAFQGVEQQGRKLLGFLQQANRLLHLSLRGKRHQEANRCSG